jgi:hypothetical protein
MGRSEAKEAGRLGRWEAKKLNAQSWKAKCKWVEWLI